MRLFVRALSVLGATACLLLAAVTSAGVTSAGATRARGHKGCAPRGPRIVLASPQAQVYAAPDRRSEVIAIYACANTGRRSFIVAGCNTSEGAGACARGSHVTLAGAMIAYEDAFVADSNGVEPGVDEWYVAVRDLKTGRRVLRVPTGAALKPRARYVGVGNLVALALRSDGAIAWIADDYERSASGGQSEVAFFDVEAADKSGVRLLAAGTDVDPASLALGVDATDIGARNRSVAGSVVYWTQGGRVSSASLK
jgi:hypothetical protein